MIKLLFSAVLVVFTSTTFADDRDPSIWVEAEVGPVWQSMNLVQIPASSGSRFSLTEFGKGPAIAGRVYVGMQITKGHELRALYAPLTLDLDGTFSTPVSFQNQNFAAGVNTRAKYKFNSYRLTYRYTLVDEGNWIFRIGFTGKVRDAEISIAQGATTAASSNVGFVPLLNVSAEYLATEDLRFIFDADALASPQGRAEDIALLMGYRVPLKTELRLGYRMVEGGSEGKSGGVYSFAWLHYLVAGARFDF